MRQGMRSLSAALLAALIVTLVACNADVGDGNRLETIRINDLSVLRVDDAGIELRFTDKSTSEADIFRCFRSSLVLIGTFGDGGRENMTNRADWSSSDPSVVRVSNGDEAFEPLNDNVDPRDAILSKGVITPVGPPGSTATITARFLGLTAELNVTILPSRLEIAPPVSTLAEGTEQPLVLTGILDGRRALTATNLVRWSVQENGVARGEVDRDTNRVRVTAGGNSDADFLTLRVDPQIVGCEDFNAASRITAVDKQFNRLELRTENFGIDPNPFEIKQATREGMRVFGVVDSDNPDERYEQDLTLQLIFNQLLALSDDDPDRQLVLESQDPDDPGAVAGRASFLLSDKIIVFSDSLPDGLAQDSARLLIHYEQGDASNNVVNREFLVSVVDDTLVDLTVSPAAAEVFPGTITRFRVDATYDDGLGNEDSLSTLDLTRSVQFSSSDQEVAGIASLAGFQGLTTTRIDNPGTAIIDAERLESNTGATIRASDSGGEATLNVGSLPLSDITIEPDNAVVPLNGSIQLRALGDNGQDLTESVVWSSATPDAVGVENVLPRIGRVYGVSDADGPVTITARLFLRGEDATTDLTATTAVTVGAPAPPPPEEPPPEEPPPEEPPPEEPPEEDCSLLDRILGNC